MRPFPQPPSPPSRRQVRDSLIIADQRMADVVDSLRKVAMRQDTIVESAGRMVEFLKTTRDTALLAGWIRIQGHVTRSFDSTLNPLDTCTTRSEQHTSELHSPDHLLC